MEWLKQNFGEIGSVKGMNLPFISGGEVITCDNTDYDNTLNDADRKGIVVSVPKMPGGHTLFVAWGNWFFYLCMAATLAIAMVSLFPKAAPTSPRAHEKSWSLPRRPQPRRNP